MKTIKRRRYKSATLESINSFYHKKNTIAFCFVFFRASGYGEDLMKIYQSLGVIVRLNGSFERNNVIFWDKSFVTVGVSQQTESST